MWVFMGNVVLISVAGSANLLFFIHDPLFYFPARQAMKNTPKRLPSVTVRSPLGASPPTMDAQADSSVPTPPMDTGGVASDDTSTTTTTHTVVRTSLL